MILDLQLIRYAADALCVESLLNGGLYLTYEQYLPNEAKQAMDPPGYMNQTLKDVTIGR